MKKVLEKIFEDELFYNEIYKANDILQIKNTSKDAKMQIKNLEDNKSVNIGIYNKNILKFDDASQYGVTYHDTNKITLKNPTTYYYNSANYSKIRNLVKGKIITFSVKVNGTVESGYAPQFFIGTNKNNYKINYSFSSTQSPFNNVIRTQTMKLLDDEYFLNGSIYTTGTTCDLELEVQIEISENATDIVRHEEQIITLQDKQKTSALEYEDITHIVCADELACDFNVSAKTSMIKKLVEQIKNVSPANEVSLESLDTVHTHTHTDMDT